MLPDIPAEEFTTALEACAEQILWEADVRRPPVDAFVVAERLGIVVGRDDAMAHRARMARLTARNDGSIVQTAILLGPEPRIERRQWSVAHEIGESAAHRAFELLGSCKLSAVAGARELVANRLASCLLLPRRWFANDGHAMQWELYDLKRCYSTASHELIARRMLEMAPPVVITVCDAGRVQWRRSNLPGRPPAMHSDERTLWQTAHRSSQRTARRLGGVDGLGDLRCWPVHEPNWRREILRSEVAHELTCQ